MTSHVHPGTDVNFTTVTFCFVFAPTIPPDRVTVDDFFYTHRTKEKKKKEKKVVIQVFELVSPYMLFKLVFDQTTPSLSPVRR